MSSPVECTAWAAYEDIPESSASMHSPAQWCGFLETATDVLWAATGRRWRGATLTETVALRAAPPRAGEGAWPYHSSWGHCPCYQGLTADWWPIWAGGTLRHTAPAAVRLPRSDVVAVTSVLLDGAPFTSWALDGNWLARTDGGTWPMCRDRTSATYTFGRTPPEAGRLACIELAVELGRAASTNPDRACQLPRRLQSITRQGITFAALDDLEFLDKGLVGIYSIDVWIRSVNPKGRTQEARVWTPDIPVARRTVGTP
jgi:hypothetical protein